MFGFLATAFSIVKGGVNLVKKVVSNIKAKKAAKKEAEALKQNTAQVTETANQVNQASPPIPFAQAFAPPSPIMSRPVEYQQPFNQEQTLQNVTVSAKAPAPAEDNKKMLMIGGGLAALMLLVVVLNKGKK